MRALLVLLLLSLSGCMTSAGILVQRDGEKSSCEVRGSGVFFAWGSPSLHRLCAEQGEGFASRENGRRLH